MKTQALQSVRAQTIVSKGRYSVFENFSKGIFSICICYIVLLLTVCTVQKTYAQGTAISTSASPTPDANAILDLQGTKGFLVPRLAADPTSSTGLMYYNTGTNLFKYYNG